MLEGNTKGAILVVTYERWHTTTYIGVSANTERGILLKELDILPITLKLLYENH